MIIVINHRNKIMVFVMRTKPSKNDLEPTINKRTPIIRHKNDNKIKQVKRVY